MPNPKTKSPETENEDFIPAVEPPQPENLQPETPNDSYVPTGIYATEYFKTVGIPYCEKCGAQFQTDGLGSPTCAESFPIGVCPRL